MLINNPIGLFCGEPLWEFGDRIKNPWTGVETDIQFYHLPSTWKYIPVFHILFYLILKINKIHILYSFLEKNLDSGK